MIKVICFRQMLCVEFLRWGCSFSFLLRHLSWAVYMFHSFLFVLIKCIAEVFTFLIWVGQSDVIECKKKLFIALSNAINPHFRRRKVTLDSKFIIYWFLLGLFCETSPVLGAICLFFFQRKWIKKRKSTLEQG